MIKLVFALAIRNVLARRQSRMVALFLVFAAAVLLIVSATVSTAQRSIQQNITQTLTGDFQLLAANAPVFKGTDGRTFNLVIGAPPELEPISHFEHVQEKIQTIPGVRAITPLSRLSVELAMETTLDRTLRELRANPSSAALKDKARHLVQVLHADIPQSLMDAKEQEMLTRTVSPSFWNEWDQAPLKAIEVLETHVSPLESEVVGYATAVGIESKEFSKVFDRMQIVDGTPIPEGQQGILISKSFYENERKLKIAHRLDTIHEAIDRGTRLSEAPWLESMIAANTSEVVELLIHADPSALDRLRRDLQSFLPSNQTDLRQLLVQFLQMTEQTFADRYRFFYERLAPALELYPYRVGDVLVVKAVSRLGQVHSLKLKFFGTYEFRGSEKSYLVPSLIDQISFSTLYGFPTAAQLQELAQMKEDDQQFASAEAFEATLRPDGDSRPSPQPSRPPLPGQREDPQTAPPQKKVLQAAVMLDGSRSLDAVLGDVERLNRQEQLGVRAIPWNQLSGDLGKWATGARILLMISTVFLGLVGTLIVSSFMMTGTLSRARELGTLRAVGASPSLLIFMIVTEAFVLVLLSGSMGCVVGAALLKLWVGPEGMPIHDESLQTVFSSRFLLQVGFEQVVVLLSALTGLVLLSSCIPAWLASRIPPLRAMEQGRILS